MFVRPTRGILLAVILVVGTSSATRSRVALAQSDLRCEIHVLGGWARSDAPWWGDLEIVWRQPKVLSGRFEFRVPNSTNPFFRTDEITLRPGRQTIRVFVPLDGSSSSPPGDVVALAFRSETERWELGTHTIRFPGSRRLLGCIAIPESGGDPIAIENRLHLRNIAPPRKLDASSAFARVRSARLPRSALDYCAFDLVVLEGEGFRELDARQLDALSDWVRAGGSLVVAPNSTWFAHGFVERHVSFLNGLLARRLRGASAVEKVKIDDGGMIVRSEVRVTPNEVDGSGAIVVEADLGRLVVLLSSGPVEISGDAWRDVLGFLWRCDTALERQRGWRASGHPGHSSLERILRPKDVRLVPMATVILVLCAFLCAVGPFDYFILGRIRRRHLTWVLFPLVSIVATGAIMLLAEHFMGSQTERRALTIVDRASDGEVLRSNTFELYYRRRAGELEIPVSRALVRSVATGAELQRYGGWSPARLEGRVPARYTVRQDVPQWSPRLMHAYRIGDNGLSGVDSELVDACRSIDWSAARRFDENRLPAWMAAFCGSRFDGGLWLMSAGSIEPLRIDRTLRYITELQGVLTGRDAPGELFHGGTPTGASLDLRMPGELDPTLRILPNRRTGAIIAVVSNESGILLQRVTVPLGSP